MPKFPKLRFGAALPRPRGFRGCCGRKVVEQTRENDDLLSSPLPAARTSQASPSTPRSPTAIDRLWGSVRLDQQVTPEEDEWKIGGRYKVLRSTPVWADAGLGGNKLGDLRPKDMVLLLEIRSFENMEAGLVLPPAPEEPGWILLEEASGSSPLERRRQLEGSWEIRARYMVKNPATMRADADMSSPEIDDVKPGEEVLVLDLGVSTGVAAGGIRASTRAMGTGFRLRMMVRTEDEKIGWISPETSTGERLLYPVNLLGPQVVELHRRSMTPGSAVAPRSSIRGIQEQSGVQLPWQAGAKYRVLETVVLRRALDLASEDLGRIAAGSIIAVQEVQTSWCPDLGLCPSARVIVDTGLEEGAEGWVRCCHKDGHDLIDTRDQLESEKVVRQLRASQVGQQPKDFALGTVDEDKESGQDDGFAEGADSSETTSGTGDAEEDDDDQPGGSKQMRFPEAPMALQPDGQEEELDKLLKRESQRTAISTVQETPGFVPPKKASRMFEEANEDNPIGEPTVVEDRTYHCCSCGVRRA